MSERYVVRCAAHYLRRHGSRFVRTLNFARAAVFTTVEEAQAAAATDKQIGYFDKAVVLKYEEAQSPEWPDV